VIKGRAVFFSVSIIEFKLQTFSEVNLTYAKVLRLCGAEPEFTMLKM
jgi:hypothetical protein